MADDIPLRGSGITDIMSLINNFKGSSTTGNSTTQENVSAEKANAMITQILEGTQGLASFQSAQKVSGLYGSSTNQLLTNDLLSRTAAQVAALSATKSTSSSSDTDPKLTAKNAAAAALASALPALLKALAGKSQQSSKPQSQPQKPQSQGGPKRSSSSDPSPTPDRAEMPARDDPTAMETAEELAANAEGSDGQAMLDNLDNTMNDIMGQLNDGIEQDIANAGSNDITEDLDTSGVVDNMDDGSNDGSDFTYEGDPYGDSDGSDFSFEGDPFEGSGGSDDSFDDMADFNEW